MTHTGSTHHIWQRSAAQRSAVALGAMLIAVASRTIIWSLIEQLRVSLMPLFHGLHRCFAVQC